MSRLVGTSRRALGATVIFVALFLAACGGASDSSGDQSPDESVVTSDVVPSESASVTSGVTESSAPTSDSSDEPSPAATIVSSDGILTVEIPEGAAPPGTEVRIEKLDENSLPEQLQVPDVAIAGYDLLPDGTVFTEPVTITYRIDPSEFDLELPEGAVPLGLLVTENEAGELETLDVELSREDEMFVARAEVTHFSPHMLMLSPTSGLRIEPHTLRLRVDGEAIVTVDEISRDGGTWKSRPLWNEPGDFEAGSDTVQWTTTDPFAVIRTAPGRATISCGPPTDAVVIDAYVATVKLPVTYDKTALEPALAKLFDLPPVVHVLGGDGTCLADGTDPIGDPYSSSGLSPLDNPSGMATDIIEISQTQPDSTTLQITVLLDGDGEGYANDPESSLYQIDVRFDGAMPCPEDCLEASIGYYDGILEPGSVVLRTVEDGEYITTRLPGASAEIEWVNPDEFVITVFNIEDGQIVESYVVAISTSAFGDQATCNARCDTD